MNFTDSDNEIMNVMATSFLDNNTRIIVNPADSEPLSCFKYCNTRGYEPKTAVARISLIRPEYFYNLDDGHPVLLLSSNGKNELNAKLSEQSRKYAGLTVFQAVIADYNIEKFGTYIEESKEIKDYELGKSLPLNLKQPDYRELPSIAEAERIIKNRKIETL